MDLLNKFLGVARWQALWLALKRSSDSLREPQLKTEAVLAALIIGSTPVLFTYLDSLNPLVSTNIPTIAFGICTVLAILVRWQCKLPYTKDPAWFQHFSLTHTAVALGCIPAVALLLLSPEMLAERHDILTQSIDPASRPPTERPSMLMVILGICAIAAWASITEEIIFRSLLVSVVRRWAVFPKQWQRDVLAATISAAVFGLAHYATWGPVAALALTGLGVGFVLAYIANDEHVLPLIIYHFVFDVLSISVSVFA